MTHAATAAQMGLTRFQSGALVALRMLIGWHFLYEGLAKMLNPYLLHHPLTQAEEQPTFAFLFSPPELPRGQVFEFALNHVLTLDHPMEAFRLDVHTVG